MGGARSQVRLRQAVLAAAELAPVASALEAQLGVNEPFHDPGVAVFGLANSVFALGDCFLEVVAPVQPGTAAGRHLARHGGDCGYMVMFDLEDLDAARTRARELGIRIVWQIDLPDISGTHLHPGDTRGAIVSLDSSRPFGSWRWGGPSWTGRMGSGAPGRLAGVTLAVADPLGVAERWGHVLGVEVCGGAHPSLELDGGAVRFRTAEQEREEGLVEIAVELPAARRAGREMVKLGGVSVRLLDEPDQSRLR